MSKLPNRLHKLALEVFGLLPGRVRRLVVRIITPHYAVGAVLVLRHEDNVLFLRSRHNRAEWSLPGGLLQRGERPREAIRREVCEELRLDIEVDEQPTLTLVDPACRRIDLVYELPVIAPPSVRVDGTETLAACWLPIDTELEDPAAVAVVAALRSRDAPVDSVVADSDVPAAVAPIDVRPAAADSPRDSRAVSEAAR